MANNRRVQGDTCNPQRSGLLARQWRPGRLAAVHSLHFRRDRLGAAEPFCIQFSSPILATDPLNLLPSFASANGHLSLRYGTDKEDAL
jgi:hypothetical protein